jgi:hypothetical protein
MKRYFRLVTDWAVASDCIHDFIPGVGYALAQEPITEYDLHPAARISAAEFEDAWHFARQSV